MKAVAQESAVLTGTTTGPVESVVDTLVEPTPPLAPTVDSATNTTTTEPSVNLEEEYFVEIIMAFELFKYAPLSDRLRPKTFSKSVRNSIHLEAMKEAI